MMTRAELSEKIDASIDTDRDFIMVVEWIGYWGRQRVAYEAKKNANPQVAGYVYSISSRENEYGIRTFDYAQNKNYDTRKQFEDALLRRLKQIEKQKHGDYRRRKGIRA